VPYVSDAQRRFFHSAGAKKAGITKSQVAEYDSASKGKSLPERKSGAIEGLKKAVKGHRSKS